MVDLCVLLWLRIDVTERVYPGATLGAEAIWSDAKSLKAMVADQFPRASYPQAKNTFLRKWFTLERLVHYGYFRVQWTNNLREHLLVDPFQPNGIRNIYIFHHASVLKQLAAMDDELRELDRIFPTGFLRETIDSLALLIPRAQVSTNNWYSAEYEVRGKGVGKVGCIRDIIFGPNGNSSNCGIVALDQMAGAESSNKSFRERSRYLFWGGRLSSFEEVVDEAEPGRMREWLRDPRTASHRYSFWLTVLSILVAIILGVIQVALTAVQVRATNSSTLCTCIPS